MEAYKQLEEAWSKWAGVSNVVACSSGTAALHLALESLGLPLGSEVIVPDLTMIACARAVTLAGLVPVFVDCGADLLIDPNLIEDAVTDQTRAIMAVHTYGRRCDMASISDVARKFDLCVIEDLAEAHGVKVDPHTDAACWSFYKNKIVCGEEGGAVAFCCEDAADAARSLRCLGFTTAHDFLHRPRGHNYRLANCLAEKVLASLTHADAYIKMRREVEAIYDEACPIEWRMPRRDAPWVYDFRVPDMAGGIQDRLVQILRANGFQARHCFKPMTQQPEYSRSRRIEGERLGARLAREVIYLAIDHDATERWSVGAAFQTVRDITAFLM